MRRLVHESTLAGHADGCQDVVARYHDCSYFSLPDLREDRRSSGFQFVLKDDKPDKVQARFDVLPLHFLRLYPAELRDVLCSATNNSITLVSVV